MPLGEFCQITRSAYSVEMFNCVLIFHRVFVHACSQSTVEVQNEQRKLMEAELASGVGGPQRWETIQELAASFNVRYDNFVKHQNPSYWPEMPLNF